MAGPWEKYAAQQPQDAQSQGPWAKYGGQPTQPAQPSDYDSAPGLTDFGKQQAAKFAVKAPQPTQFEQERDPANQSGVVSTAMSRIKSMLTTAPQAQNPYPGMGTDQKTAAFNQAQQEGQQEKNAGYGSLYRAATIPAATVGVNVPAMEHQADIGNARGVLGEAAAPAALASAPAIHSVVAPAIGAAADAMKAGGAGVLNRTVGALKTDFSHGANPGAGYLEGGGTPALTMGSLADKAANVRSNAGAKIGSLYDQSDAVIPADAVRETIGGPIQKLEGLQSGPGGTGVSPQLTNYAAQMEPTLKNAWDRGGFTPRQLFDEMKKPIAESTNWKDPSQFDLNTVRQQNVGGIGGLLTDAVPEAKPLNSIYQGASKLADRAAYRSNTGVSPLSQIARKGVEAGLGGLMGVASGHPLLAAAPFVVDSIPARTSLAYGLYNGGKSLPALARFASVAGPTANVGSVYKKHPDQK